MADLPREASSSSCFCTHGAEGSQPTLKPWLREESVDSFNAKWRSEAGASRMAFRSDSAAAISPADVSPETEKLVQSKPDGFSTGGTARLRHAWRWRLPLLALRMSRLEPLRLDAADLDRELTTSPQTSVGTLPNGMTYFIRSCNSPEGRAELRLVFRVGSMNEEDDELGLAHFVEHAAFIKLKSFDKGELLKFLESIGASVGADLNAHTGFSETVYKLNVPIKDEALLVKAMKILRDWCDGIVIDDAEIERERNVVEEEWRSGKGCSERMQRQWMNEVLGHTRQACRIPIGGRGDDAGLQCVRTAPPQRLRSFIDKNYRPELVTLVAVGDFTSHEQVRTLLSETFTSWPRTPSERFAPPRPIAERAPCLEPGLKSGTKFLVLTDDELTQADLDLGLILPPRPWARTARGIRDRILEDMWFVILEARLARSTEATLNPPFSEAYARRRDFEGAPIVEFGVEMDSEQNWMEALETLITEVLRLAKYGVQKFEVLCAAKEFEMSLQAKQAGRHSMESDEVAASLVTHVTSDGATPALLTDEYYLRLSLALLQGVTAEDVSAHCAGIATGRTDGRSALACCIAPDWITLRLPMVSVLCDTQAVQTVLGRCVADLESGKIGPPADRTLPSADALFAAAAAAAAEHPVQIVSTTPLPLSTFVLPSAEGGATAAAPAECSHWVFNNGAAVTLCRTTFSHSEEDDIMFTALAPGGSDECNAGDERALLAMSSAENGIDQLSKADLKTALTLSNVMASAFVQVSEDCRTISGSCSSNLSDLGALLDLAWMNTKRPRLSEVSLVRGMQKFSELLELRERDPMFQYNRRVCALTKGSDPRFQPDTAADVAPLKEAKALRQVLELHQLAFGRGAASDWSFVLVGLLPPEAELRQLLEAKLGAFDAPGVAVHVKADASESTVKDMGGADKGWLRTPKLTYMPKEFAGGQGIPVHEVIQSGMEEQSTTIMFFQCAHHPVPTVGDEAWGSEAASVAEDRDMARLAAVSVAEILLRRELRETLGVVYSVDCGYDGCAPHTREPSQLDARVSVAYTSASKDFHRCVEVTLKVLRQFAEKGPSKADFDAVVEQYRRSVMEESQRSTNYRGLILDAIKLARCRGGKDGRVLSRAADVPVDKLGAHITRTSDHLGTLMRAVTMETVCAAARDCFSERRQYVVVSLLPQDRGEDDEVVVATLAPAPEDTRQKKKNSSCCAIL